MYNQGKTRKPEDGIVFNPPRYFGVTDGISPIYTPEEGPMMFGEKTGGQLASQAVSFAFGMSSLFGGKSLRASLNHANDLVRQVSQKNGLPLNKSEFLPSATFCVAKIGDQEIEIVQGGDTLAIWETRDGKIGGTPNLIFEYEQRQVSTIARLMEKNKGNRQKMWEDFRPYLAEDRRKNINAFKGFSIINGQPWFKDYLQEFTLTREDVKTLIIFSDGLVPFEKTADLEKMARFILDHYKTGGLNRILEVTREIADKNKKSSHEDYAEAAGIAIEF